MTGVRPGAGSFDPSRRPPMHLHFWSKRGECPDKRAARNNRANKRKPEKQIVSGHAGFRPKQVRAHQLPDGLFALSLSLELSVGVLSPSSILLVNACLENHIRSSDSRLSNLIAPVPCLLRQVCPSCFQAIVGGLLLAYASAVHHLGLGSACGRDLVHHFSTG